MHKTKATTQSQFSAVAPPQKAADRFPASGTAKRAPEKGDLEQAEKQEAASMDAEGERRAAANKAAADTHATEAQEKLERDTARYEALAREHGADLSEEGFNEALKRISKPVAKI